jgi:predicted Zn-dependent protease
MTPERCRETFGIVERCARSLGVADVEAMIGMGAQALTRFANNVIHQNVAERSQFLSVRVLLDGRTARASTNILDADSVRRIVEEAVAVARCQEPDPALAPLAEPASYQPLARHSADTAGATPDSRAAAVADAIRVVEEQGQTAAGIFSHSESVFAVLNSRGVFAWHPETISVFSITAMADDSSGWAKGSSCRTADLDPVALARRASQKARASAKPSEISPGRYTVVLEPAAVLDLVGQIFSDFSGTALRDERSFLTGRMGEPLFGAAVAISDDVYDPRHSGPPFDAEGVPRRRLVLVEDGAAREVAWSRQAAHLAGVQPTGHGYPPPSELGEAPANIVIAGGSTSLEQMLASTQSGILVTRLWYIREVDPYEKIMTGMTRDGTFLIERGEVVGGLRNFRFNQSVIELLNNVESLSPSERTSGEESPDMVVPAMKAHEFNFTEVTKF